MSALLLTTLVPALLPVASDAIRGIIGKFTKGAGAIPQNVDEECKLLKARAEHSTAMALLDKPSGNISQWVADLRASFRYIAAGLIIIAAIGTIYYPPADPAVTDLAWSAARSAWSFIFGDRMYNYIKNGK